MKGKRSSEQSQMGAIMDMKESLGPAAVFPLGEPNDAYAAYFSGRSHLAPLAEVGGVSASNVTFELGCRNN